MSKPTRLFGRRAFLKRFPFCLNISKDPKGAQNHLRLGLWLLGKAAYAIETSRMPASFQDRKAKILNELSTPDEQYQDLSPKGSVDAGIRDLISEINDVPEYVTTSSCAGRTAVYLEGIKGAKGGGRWLFTSHDPVDLSSVSGVGMLHRLFGLLDEGVGAPPDEAEARFVHFKFEPMVGPTPSLVSLRTHPT